MINRKSVLSFTLVTVLVTGITETTLSHFAWGIAQAETNQMSLTVPRLENESYEAFLGRAEAIATNAIETRFQQNPSLNQFELTIMGENQGAIAPVLSLVINRERWTLDPTLRRWANYFPSSQFLLGFNQPPPEPEIPSTAPDFPPPAIESERENASESEAEEEETADAESEETADSESEETADAESEETADAESEETADAESEETADAESEETADAESEETADAESEETPTEEIQELEPEVAEEQTAESNAEEK